MACFDAAKKKSPKGRRYTINWMYHCVLMRIKNPALYEHIRENNILPLPCKETIKGYTQKMSCSYGFKDVVFELMETKAPELKPQERRGIITLDEMKLTPGTTFNKATLQVEGFVDMGDFNDKTSKKPQKPDLGDHALVVMFQPFRGKWVQALACFLSKGNVKADVLSNIILEATAKLEKSGYFVDGVVMDGATWNRQVWTSWGITEDNPSVTHPCDTDRRLWMLSDYPHLLKCMRNCISEGKEIHLPEGLVELRHWDAVMEAEQKQKGLRQAYKLTPEHIRPGFYSKMKVGMAFQFWSRSVSIAMLTYRTKGVSALRHCDASSSFCLKLNDVSDSMNSSVPATALKPGSSSWKIIEDFIHFFKKIRDPQQNPKNVQAQKEKFERQQRDRQTKKEAKLKEKEANNPQFNKTSTRKRNPPKEKELKFHPTIFSNSTDTGLAVTLKATLEIAEFLCTKCEFKYLMTARLNQDCLESFFGMLRGACGSNTHPEAITFAQIFRLLSLYSLIKPPKGSNITGGTMLTTLLNAKDIQGATKEERKQAFEEALDNIILQGENLDDLPDIFDELGVHSDHNYADWAGIDDFALNYVSGFVARHSRQFLHKGCEACKNTLEKKSTEANEKDLFITLKSKGFLTYPSDKLVATLRVVEEAIMSVTSKTIRDKNILFMITDKLQFLYVPQVGCDDHKPELTKKIVKSYLIMIMFFVSDRWNKDLAEQKQKKRNLRKQAHLT